MGKRSRMNRANKAAEAGAEEAAKIHELYAEMRKVAEDALEGALARLREGGADEKDLITVHNTSRLLCISDIWEMDLGRVALELARSGSEDTVVDKIVEVLMEGVILNEAAKEGS
jgi:hypothetical protein